RRCRPPRGWGPGRRRAAPRIAPAAPRSASPGPGRARSPPAQRIEHKFETESRTLRSPTGTAPRRGWAVGARNSTDPGDSKGQHETTHIEINSGSSHSFRQETPGPGFTRYRPQYPGSDSGAPQPGADGVGWSDDFCEYFAAA